MATSITGLNFCFFVLSTVLLNGRCQESCKTEEKLGEKLGSIGTKIDTLEDSVRQNLHLIERLKTEFAQVKNLTDKLREESVLPSGPSCPDAVSATYPTSTEPRLPTVTEDPKSSLPKDCSEHLEMGQKKSGVYTIYLNRSSSKPLQVFCDMETDGGGWTVFQRRGDFGEPRQNFNRYWNDYKVGFGDLTEEFWLGNEALHALTSDEPITLRIDMGDWDDGSSYAKYSYFKVRTEEEQYRTIFGSYSGNAEDAFPDQISIPFSTSDRDNDKIRGNCARVFKGGWWYTGCGLARLNGLFYVGGKYEGKEEDGIVWYGWKKDFKYSLKFTEMKLRPERLE